MSKGKILSTDRELLEIVANRQLELEKCINVALLNIDKHLQAMCDSINTIFKLPVDESKGHSN